MAGARGRLSSVDDRGARFAIEEGEAEVKVIPRRDAQWLVDAGPFLISVRGTVFTAAWNGATEQLDIHMKKGWCRCRTAGRRNDGGAGGSASLRQHQAARSAAARNQRLRRRHWREVRHRGRTGPGAGRSPGCRRGRVAHAVACARRGCGAARAGRPARPGVGRRRLAGGDFDSILRDAERRGFRRAMAEASSEDLAALADAARYRRRNEIARQALLTERARFPRSARASDAAFLLGRMEEGSGRGKGRAGEARALEWYDVYLKEAPSGAYSSEALGRKMVATERVRGALAARQVAEEYLRRFPGGTYAGAARALRAVQ